MDELKDLVIQSLETKGVLGQLRAQLRSCVFKAIDEQDNTESGRSQFHWENPHAQKVTQGNEKIVAELFREYLEFYKMDYTLNIFGPEANLTGSTPDKSDLAKRAGMGKANEKKPIIVQILESFMKGDKGAPGPIAEKKEEKLPLVQAAKRQVDDFNLDQYSDDFSLKSSDKGDKKSPELEESVQSRLDAAGKMVEDSLREEKSGYGLDKPKTDFFAKAAEKKPEAKLPSEPSQKSSENNLDNYDDDFEDGIEEDLPSEDEPDVEIEEEAKKQVEGSGNYGITVSQSLGVDPSVDSLALEDYDHVEPVERLASH